MVKKDEVVERVRSRNGDYPCHNAGHHSIVLICLLHLLMLVNALLCPGEHEVHEDSGDDLDNKKLQNILFTTVGEVFGFLPVGELIGLLAQVEGEKMVDFVLVFDHYVVNFFILHFILSSMLITSFLS